MIAELTFLWKVTERWNGNRGVFIAEKRLPFTQVLHFSAHSLQSEVQKLTKWYIKRRDV